MSLVTLSGVPVLSGVLTRPLWGPWVAELELETAYVGGELAAPGMLLVGTKTHGGTFRGRSQVRVVGGRGGFDAPVSAKFYRSMTLRSLLTECLAVGGESLSATSDTAVTGRSVDAWARARGTVGTALDAVLGRVPGAGWRTLADGSTWAGAPTWPARVLADAVQVDEDPVDGRVEIATDTYDLDAGVTLDGRRLGKVQYVFSADSVRAFWWVLDAA